MKYLFINTFAGKTSTGKIAANQCRKLTAEGHKCVLAYGRDKENCDDVITYKIEGRAGSYIHGIMTRFFDQHGFWSGEATKKFLHYVDGYDPDVVWLHNIHGYYINVEMLFNWIKQHPEKKYFWTLHDCWPMTGHCAHFVSVGCDQWKIGCRECRLLRTYPVTYTGRYVYCNYLRKQKAFSGVNNMTIITPSQWLRDVVAESYLSAYKVQVRNNHVNQNIFFPQQSNLREICGWINKKVILCVANDWSPEKGLNDIGDLVPVLDHRCIVVVVGLKKKQIKHIPSAHYMDERILSQVQTTAIMNKEAHIQRAIQSSLVIDISVALLQQSIHRVCGIVDSIAGSQLYVFERISDPRKLAILYGAADVFINPTHADTYPTVNMESIACGTPVVTYDVGGCKETIKMP